MIHFFRKIRHDLIANSKFYKYLKYAFGEIVLVVIGILIALQFNNWNEMRKNENQFKAVLQQIYTVIDQDVERLIVVHYELDKQILIIDSLSKHSEQINPKILPHLLFYTDLVTADIDSEISYHLGFLKFNPLNLEQSQLNKGLIAFSDKINEQALILIDHHTKYVTHFLEDINLPDPSLTFGYSVMNNYEFIDTDFFTGIQIEHSTKLIEDPLFQVDLKSSRSRKVMISRQIMDLLNMAKQSLDAIKTYYPEVGLLYSNVGLVGDATQNNNWDKNISLNLTNEIESIWEADVELNNGFVKFREGENWYFNWGGDTFPEGNSLAYYGSNIVVKEGKYHVILNLTEKTYRFIEIDN